MRRKLNVLRTCLSFTLSVLALAQPSQAATEAEVQVHLRAAERAAGDDLKAFFRLCQPAPVQRPTVSDDSLAKLIATPGPQAAAAFDNLIYLGSGWVSAWLLKTDDGLLLIDALNNAEEVDRLIVGGMKSLGLDPAQIKTLVVTHGHGDHYGGAQRLKQVVGGQGPRIVMSDIDWTMTATQLEFATPLWAPPPVRDQQRDVAVRDGNLLRQGSASLQMFVTPGHTLGTLSPIIEVTASGRTHKALIWGGTGFNFGRDLERIDAYIRSTERMREVVRERQVDVLLSNHPSYDGTLTKLSAVQGGGPNPYVVGTETVVRALTVAGECARANRSRFEMTK